MLVFVNYIYLVGFGIIVYSWKDYWALLWDGVKMPRNSLIVLSSAFKIYFRDASSVFRACNSPLGSQDVSECCPQHPWIMRFSSLVADPSRLLPPHEDWVLFPSVFVGGYFLALGLLTWRHDCWRETAHVCRVLSIRSPRPSLLCPYCSSYWTAGFVSESGFFWRKKIMILFTM